MKKDIFKKVADMHGTTPQEVRNEIQKAIDEGFKDSDPKIQRLLKNIPCKGDRPTPEELIAHMSREIMKRRYMS